MIPLTFLSFGYLIRLHDQDSCVGRNVKTLNQEIAKMKKLHNPPLIVKLATLLLLAVVALPATAENYCGLQNIKMSAATTANPTGSLRQTINEGADLMDQWFQFELKGTCAFPPKREKPTDLGPERETVFGTVRDTIFTPVFHDLDFCFQVDQITGEMVVMTNTSPNPAPRIFEHEQSICAKFDKQHAKTQKVKVYVQPKNNECKDSRYINKIIASMSNPFGYAFFEIIDNDTTRCD